MHPRHLCSVCKHSKASKLNCKNIEKVVCFSCPRRDHFSGDCDTTIRVGNPRWSKTPSNRREATLQLQDWKTRCNEGLRLLKACDRKEVADALETRRPVPRGCKEPSDMECKHENEKVANIFSEQRPIIRDTRCRLTRTKQHLNAMKKFCLVIFQELEQYGLAQAAMNPLTR